MILIAGAYPAAPRRDAYDTSSDYTAADDAFTRSVVTGSASLGANGLELAWQARALHPREAEHLAAVPAGWRHVVTTIPDTMITWRESPTFGLASLDESGRRAAVARLAALRDHLESLAAQRRSPQALAVLIHSAPRVDRDAEAARGALERSLRTAAGWDWGGAELLVEHCDAVGTGHPPAKGFLPLHDELAAVSMAGGERTPVGVVVNWGRSVIEGRSRQTALDHISATAAARLLRGLMFSGVAPAADEKPWLDNHLPTSDLDPRSVMRPEDVSAALETAREEGADLLFAGVKVCATTAATTSASRAKDVTRVLAHIASATSTQP